MTTLFATEVRCFVCGHVAEQMVVASTNMRGSPDLDGRPPEMARSNLQYEIQLCPSCGYCALKISEGTELAKEIVASGAYQKALGSEQMPSLASRFICCGLIEQAGAARKKDELIDKVLRFERVLAVAGDTGLYTVEDAVGR